MNIVEYPKLSIEDLRDLREDYLSKAKIFETKQMAAKISLNSAYGACGNKFFRYYSLENASAVTLTGQMIIQNAKSTINSYLNRLLKTSNEEYVVYCDTDSILFCLDKLVQKMFPDDQSDINKITNFIDKFITTKIEEEIQKTFNNFQKTLNHRENLVSFKREAIANKAIFKSKKRYIMNVIDNEGVRYKEPELKIMGIEVVKSSTPRFCRDKLKQAIKIIINEDNNTLKTFIRQTKKEFKKAPLDIVAFPRGVTHVEKFVVDETEFIKGTPLHVRGSIAFNNLLKIHKMNHVEEIGNGAKVKYLYLREPNHIRSNVICFVDELPEEFDIHRYIDYEVMFNKSFIEPLKAITSVIGWDVNINGLNFV